MYMRQKMQIFLARDVGGCEGFAPAPLPLATSLRSRLAAPVIAGERMIGAYKGAPPTREPCPSGRGERGGKRPQQRAEPRTLSVAAAHR